MVQKFYKYTLRKLWNTFIINTEAPRKHEISYYDADNVPRTQKIMQIKREIFHPCISFEYVRCSFSPFCLFLSLPLNFTLLFTLFPKNVIDIKNFVIYSDTNRKNTMWRLLLPYTYSHFLTEEKWGIDLPKQGNRRCILTTLAPSRPTVSYVFTDINRRVPIYDTPEFTFPEIN
jgi:hypothetical protein